MNTEEMLRTADPAGSRTLDAGQVEALLAESRRRRDEQPLVPAVRSRRRSVAVAGVVVALVAATMTAAVAVRDAQPRPAAPAGPLDRTVDLRRVFGADARIGEAKSVLNAPGPEGTTLTLWTVPTLHATTCYAVLDDVGSAVTSDETAVCDPVPALPDQAPIAEPLGGSGGTWRWTSPTTGTVWFGSYATALATATRVELRVDDVVAASAVPVDGAFVTGGIREGAAGCPVLVGLTSNGIIAERSYPRGDCDPASQVVPTGPAQSSSDVVQEPWGEAANWTPAIGVIVHDLIAQPAAKAAHLATGQTLITVQLQFYRSGGPPLDLPTDVGFELPAGPRSTSATPDFGHAHADPSLTGLVTKNSVDGNVHVVQRSFDVPTDLLGSLAVRIPGDATHPTVVLHDSQHAL